MQASHAIDRYFSRLIQGDHTQGLFSPKGPLPGSVEERTQTSARTSFDLQEEEIYEVEHFDSVVKHLSNNELDDIKKIAKQALSAIKMATVDYKQQFPVWANEGINHAKRVLKIVEKEQKNRKSSGFKTLIGVFQMAKKVGVDTPAAIWSAAKDYLNMKFGSDKEETKLSLGFLDVVQNKLGEEIETKIEEALYKDKSTISFEGEEVDIEDAFGQIANTTEINAPRLAQRIWHLKYDPMIQLLKQRKQETGEFPLTPDEAISIHNTALSIINRSHLFEYAPSEDRDAVIQFLPKKQKKHGEHFTQINDERVKESKSLMNMFKVANRMEIDFFGIAKKVFGHIIDKLTEERKIEPLGKTIREQLAEEMLERINDEISVGTSAIPGGGLSRENEKIIDHLMKVDLSTNENLEMFRADTGRTFWERKYGPWIDEMRAAKREYELNGKLDEETVSKIYEIAKALIKSPLLKYTDHFPLVLFCLGDFSEPKFAAVKALTELEPRDTTLPVEDPTYALQNFWDEVKAGLESTQTAPEETRDEAAVTDMAAFESELNQMFEEIQKLEKAREDEALEKKMNAEFEALKAQFAALQGKGKDEEATETRMGENPFVDKLNQNSAALPEPSGSKEIAPDEVLALCNELLSNIDEIMQKDPEEAKKIFALVHQFLT